MSGMCTAPGVAPTSRFTATRACKNRPVEKTCANGHTFEKTTDCPVCPTCERSRTASGGFPKIGGPATRALENSKIQRLEELANWSERDLLALHGMGPKAVGILREHLAGEGLAFKS